MEKQIYKKMVAIMSDIGAIAKAKKNKMQNYQFRGIDDIYNELHNVMAKHGVFTVPQVLEQRTEERQTKNGGNLIYRIFTVQYHFYADDGSMLSSIVIGEGMDSGDKAGNKAMSAAHKYCLLQVFCIPTEDLKDSENDSQEPSTKKQVKKPALPKKHIDYAEKIEKEICSKLQPGIPEQFEMLTSINNGIAKRLGNNAEMKRFYESWLNSITFKTILVKTAFEAHEVMT
jgi:hypothetical protein